MFPSADLLEKVDAANVSVDELGVPEAIRPECVLIGEDGNAFNLIALAARCLKRADMKDKAEELNTLYWGCGSYDELLWLISQYVDIS